MTSSSATSPPGDERGASGPARVQFAGELEQLRLQVEVMALRVGDALHAMQEVLATGDSAIATRAVEADDAIDAMHVSLTARCYDLLRRENPVAGDFRFTVSVLRVLEELERIGDLALRVVKLAPEQPELARAPSVLDTLVRMAALAEDDYRAALDAWSARDEALARGLPKGEAEMDAQYATLTRCLVDLEGADAVPLAITAVLAGRAIERIADHTVIVVERLRYLLTGDERHLASEVR